MHDSDDSARLVDLVATSLEKNDTLFITGHRSKSFLNPLQGGSVLSTLDHSGVIEYRPDELVITVRAGTSLRDVNQVLASEGQMIGADAPLYGGQGTVGGAIACGFSGPGRPWLGSIRDVLLGVEMINGRAERLQFGGKVIKNVAGFDLSRLLAGSRGTFGVILSASFKLLPLPELTVTTVTECTEVEAHQRLMEFFRKPSTMNASCYFDGQLQLRFAGAAKAVESEVATLEAEEEVDSTFWARLRDHELPFFLDSRPLWRASIERGSFFQNLDHHDVVLEWGGSLVWIKTNSMSRPELHETTGYVEGFRNTESTMRSASKYGARLKRAFDPNEIFNPGIVV